MLSLPGDLAVGGGSPEAPPPLARRGPPSPQRRPCLGRSSAEGDISQRDSPVSPAAHEGAPRLTGLEGQRNRRPGRRARLSAAPESAAKAAP